MARRTRTVRTLLGPLEVTRGYFHCKACRQAHVAGGFAPFDDRLGVRGTSLSPGLARAAALARSTRREGARARTLIDAEHAADFATRAEAE